MRFEGNSRGITRSDYEQFARFLGSTQPKYTRVTATNEPACNNANSRPIGMVYGVRQSFNNVYEPEIALETGTIFEELNLPFYPVGCRTKNGEGCL